MKKICFVATVPAAVSVFLGTHIRAASDAWSVKIISHPQNAHLLKNLNAEFIPLAFERKASPWRDLRALVRLTWLFYRERFDLVHSILPKTGLLAMCAAWMARVPVRIHTFTGQVWMNKRGWKRSALKMFDKLIVSFATHILVDSPSQRDFLISEKILSPDDGVVIGSGSICGVDPRRFHPDEDARMMVRAELGVEPQQIVILFLGRLNRDKGILDLAAAFANVASRQPNAVMVLVGAEEDVTFEQVQKICGDYRKRLRRVQFTEYPEKYMAMADIFCLPSYREGFGQVIIEAAASGVPTVASRIYGITDAVEDGKTGLLSPAGDVVALTRSLLELVENPGLRQQMGEEARQRTLKLFPSAKITEEMLKLYAESLSCPAES